MATTSIKRRKQIGRDKPRESQPNAARLDMDERRRQSLDKFITTAEACDYLRYRGKNRLKSLYRFLEQNGVPVIHRSARALLIKRVDLDAAIGAGR